MHTKQITGDSKEETKRLNEPRTGYDEDFLGEGVKVPIPIGIKLRNSTTISSPQDWGEAR